MSQDDSQYSGAARIHHCLLRVTRGKFEEALIEGLAALFARLAYLKTIVLETSHSSWGDHDVQSVTEALRKVCKAEVEHRTCEEAHKLALQAKKNSARPPGAALLSPFWCLQTHADSWRAW